MNSIPRRFTNDVTELAKARNRDAAERTLTSWIQNCLGLIGFGAGFNSILTALHQTFPEKGLTFSLTLAHTIGLIAIGLGIFLLILGMVAHRVEVRFLGQEDYVDRSPRLLNLGVLVSSVIFYGLIASVAVLFILPWQS